MTDQPDTPTESIRADQLTPGRTIRIPMTESIETVETVTQVQGPGGYITVHTAETGPASAYQWLPTDRLDALRQAAVTTPDRDNTASLTDHATAIMTAAAATIPGHTIYEHLANTADPGLRADQAAIHQISALISTARVRVDWPGSTHTAEPLRDAYHRLRAELLRRTVERDELRTRVDSDAWNRLTAERDRLLEASKSVIGENSNLRQQLTEARDPTYHQVTTSGGNLVLYIHRCQDVEWWNEATSGPINEQGCDACESALGGWQPIYVRAAPAVDPVIDHCHHTAALEQRAVKLREQIMAATRDRCEALCRDAYAERDLYAAELDKARDAGHQQFKAAQAASEQHAAEWAHLRIFIGQYGDDGQIPVPALRQALRDGPGLINTDQTSRKHPYKASQPPGGWPTGGQLAGKWLDCSDCGDTIFPSEHVYPASDGVRCAVCRVKATAATGLGSTRRAQDPAVDPVIDHATAARELFHLGTIPPEVRTYTAPSAEVIAAGIGHGILHLADVVARLVPGVPAVEVDPDEIERLLANARDRLGAAATPDEETEVVADLLADWYAGWPASAVTDPHWPIARELVAMLTPPAAEACEWCTQPATPGAPGVVELAAEVAGEGRALADPYSLRERLEELPIEPVAVDEQPATAEHDWQPPNGHVPWTHCGQCGTVQRHDGVHGQCTGPARVELRQSEQS